MNWSQVIEQVTLPVDWIGVREVAESAQSLAFRDARPQHIGRRFSHGIMVEVLAHGHFGYGSTNDRSSAGFAQALQQAYDQTIAAANWAIYPFLGQQRPPARGNYTSPVQIPQDALSLNELCDRLVRVCQTLQVSDRIVKTTAYADLVTVEMQLYSSDGAAITQNFSYVVSDYGATAQEGAVVQRRGDKGLMARCHQAGWEIFDESVILARASQIGEQVLELLQAEECPDQTTTLVLAPDQMLLQIHESVGHPLEIDRILGDERNYAGGSFLQPQDFGTYQYGSALMNITFDPSVPGEFASYAFDDVGQPAQRQYLIENGLLQRGLGGYDSQTRSGIPGVANMRACSWNRPPIDRMANLNLEPGNCSFPELIGAIEKGVYMESNRSWSIDDYRRKFQFGCEYAKLIENGQLTKTIRNPNYRGVTTQFWHNLIGVANHSEAYGSPFCGKGEPNQAIRVGHASPACRFANVEVFGGEKNSL